MGWGEGRGGSTRPLLPTQDMLTNMIFIKTPQGQTFVSAHFQRVSSQHPGTSLFSMKGTFQRASKGRASTRQDYNFGLKGGET